MKSDHSSHGESVFLIALGRDASRLHPRVLRYAEGSGDGAVTGTGTFRVAGSRFRWLGLLLRPLVGPQLLVTRFQRNVPFTVVNRRVVTAHGGSELHATRSFHFQKGTQVFSDVLVPGSTPGTLRNRVGAAGRVELELRCTATAQGFLRLSERRAWMRFGRIKVRLPRALAVRIDVEDGYDEGTGRQTIDATVRNPILGTVLEYRGSFTFRAEA